MAPLTFYDSWMMIRFLDLYLRVNFTITWFLHRSPQNKTSASPIPVEDWPPIWRWDSRNPGPNGLLFLFASYFGWWLTPTEVPSWDAENVGVHFILQHPSEGKQTFSPQVAGPNSHYLQKIIWFVQTLGFVATRKKIKHGFLKTFLFDPQKNPLNILFETQFLATLKRLNFCVCQGCMRWSDVDSHRNQLEGGEVVKAKATSREDDFLHMQKVAGKQLEVLDVFSFLWGKTSGGFWATIWHVFFMFSFFLQISLVL